MATYKLIGARYLRKYTENGTSPVYAAAVQAQRIVNTLCDVPWERVSQQDAEMTYHTNDEIDAESKITGFEMNVIARDKFDAALFCAGHVGGQHRAYANAACYRYALPDDAVGASLTSLVARVTSDPYNSQGARIHVMTNSTGEIPTNCHTCRGENSSGQVIENGTTASGAAPRTEVISTTSGDTYWYPTTSTVTLEPENGLTLQKYLFVFVLMESYSTVRGNWLEGCSFIENKISITTSSAVTGWEDGATIDLSTSAADTVVFPVVSGGVLPYTTNGSPTGERHVVVRADANLIADADGRQAPEGSAPGSAAASALSRAFAAFYSGDGETPAADGFERTRGASFNVVRTVEMLPSAEGDDPTETDVIHIECSALVVPFAWPRDVSPSKIRLEFAEPSLPDGARFNVFLASATDYLTSLSAEQLKTPGLYDGGDGAPFKLLGTIAGGTSAEFDVPSGTGRMGTLVVTAWMPPEAYDLAEGGPQGTGATGFLPDISIIAER